MLERDHLTRWINYRDQLYVFPSEGGKGERYDPVVNGWSTLDLSTGTRSTKVAVVRGEIYAIEVNILTIKSTIKRYDVERCSWQTVLSSHEGCRENPCVVASGNHLYVCGGNVGGEIFSKAERFDTVGNKSLEEIANIRGTQRIVSVNYLFGRPLIPSDFLERIVASNSRGMTSLMSVVFGWLKMSFWVP